MGKQSFRFFKAYRCSEKMLLSNHEAFTKAEKGGGEGILGVWRNRPVI